MWIPTGLFFTAVKRRCWPGMASHPRFALPKVEKRLTRLRQPQCAKGALHVGTCRVLLATYQVGSAEIALQRGVRAISLIPALRFNPRARQVVTSASIPASRVHSTPD